MGVRPAVDFLGRRAGICVDSYAYDHGADLGDAADLDEDTRKRLTEIADKCPVHKTLEHESAVVTTLKVEG